VQPGNYGHNDFADGYDLVSQPNTLQTEGVKTCQVPLGKVFRPLTPDRQLVIHAAGVLPAFGRVTLQQPATSELHMLLSFLRGKRIRQRRLAIGQPGVVTDVAMTREVLLAFGTLVTGRKPVSGRVSIERGSARLQEPKTV
jgi:hypothetical protein